MSTRCFISKKTKDGYVGVYSHWDGYPEKPGAGWILKNYYRSPQKINALIALGDISVLRENIGRKHSFDKQSQAGKYGEEIRKKGYTTFYHRDRGDAWSKTKPRKFKTFAELKKYAEEGWTEYLYVYQNGKWRHMRV